MLHFLLNSRTSGMLNESTVPVVRRRRCLGSPLHTVIRRISQVYRCSRSKWLCSTVCQQQQQQESDSYDSRTKPGTYGTQISVRVWLLREFVPKWVKWVCPHSSSNVPLPARDDRPVCVRDIVTVGPAIVTVI